MRIVLLYDQLNTGGTEKLFVMISNLLYSKGHEVKVVLIKGEAALDNELEKAIPVYYLDRKSKMDMKAMKQLSSICKQADIVHVHTYYNWRYLYITSTIFSIGAAKVILHEHSDLRNINSFDKYILTKLDGLIAVNQNQSAIALAAGVDKHKVQVLPNIVECNDQFVKPSNTRKKIVMVGNIRREKNYALAINIVAQLASLELTIYGNVNDTTYECELQKHIDKVNVKDRVKFVSGVNYVPQYFHQYDLALHTATNETGPLVVLEYLSAGLPFFCSIAGQSPALISTYLPQQIIATYHCEDWLHAITTYYSYNEQKLQALSKQMQEAAATLLDTNTYYQSLLTAYNQALPAHVAV